MSVITGLSSLESRIANEDITASEVDEILDKLDAFEMAQTQETARTDNWVQSVDQASNGQMVLTAKEVEHLKIIAADFPTRKKWVILSAVFLVQISMNANASAYANSVVGMAKHFAVDASYVRYGQMAFLVAYAFGCEAWAPWSEEMGRFWVLQCSLFLVNAFHIMCALAPNIGTVFAARALGGLSSAGGSVTLGIVADLYGPADQQYALAYIVFASCAGSVVAPIVGGFIETHLPWQWVFWVCLILGAVTQVIHAFFVPETREEVILDREAKRMRKAGVGNMYGPRDVAGSFWQRISFQKIGTLMWRPYWLLFTEPIVGFLSLLSGFSDALIFTGLDSFGPVLNKWDFSITAKGLAFIPLLVGYLIATLSFLPVYRADRKAMNGRFNAIKPERRLRLLLFLVLLEPIGLFGFAWTSWGPPIHWALPLFFTCLIGIANLAIYQATIDYTVATYGPYAASASGGNGFCRDLLAGIASVYATPLYHKIAPNTHYQTIAPTLILSAIGLLLCIPVYVFYFKGEYFRKRSPYAVALQNTREEEMAQSEKT